MAKRELIDKKKLIRDVKESNAIDFTERMKFSNVVEHQKPITDEEIVKPYLEKLESKLLDCCDPRIRTETKIPIKEVLDLIDSLLTEKGELK